MLGKSFLDLANSSMEMYKPLLRNMVDNLGAVNETLAKGDFTKMKMPKLFKETCNCCPPEFECPPHCIAAIERHAMQGERIIVPFYVKNTCSHQKTYRIGVRDLTDADGQMAPSQPQLNRHEVKLEPGQSMRVLMQVDLNGFKNSSTYTTEIVLREKDINQNICFTLKIDNDPDHVVAEPKEERKMKLKWQSWKDHYYCEPNKGRVVPTLNSDPATVVPVVNKPKDS